MQRATILVDTTISELTDSINFYLKEGYSMQGGVTITRQNEYLVIMVKEY